MDLGSFAVAASGMRLREGRLLRGGLFELNRKLCTGSVQAERGGSEQTVLLQDFRRVFLADEHRGQCDDGFQLFAVQQLYRLSQALRTWRRIEECRGELAFVDPGNAFIGQS